MALPQRTPRGGAIDVVRTIVSDVAHPARACLVFVLEDERGM
jgi:hypothetical protein